MDKVERKLRNFVLIVNVNVTNDKGEYNFDYLKPIYRQVEICISLIL